MPPPPAAPPSSSSNNTTGSSRAANPFENNNTTRPAPSPFTFASPYPGQYSTYTAIPNGANKRRRVHFSDDYTPSSLSLRLKLGPRGHAPTMTLKIGIYFTPGRLPRIKVRTKRAGERRRKEGDWEIGR